MTDHFGFEGRRYTFGEELAICHYVGFRHGLGLLKAVATAYGESYHYEEAWHDNLDDDGVTVLSTDWGHFQINDRVHSGQISKANMLRVVPAARYAFQLSKGGADFRPWYAYRNKSIGYQEGLKWAKWYYENGRGWRKINVKKEFEDA